MCDLLPFLHSPELIGSLFLQGTDAKWVTGDVKQAEPLVEWTNHTGVVTMTYFPALKKYIMCISTASIYPMMTHQFDTYFLESDSITGPWSYVTYMSMFGPEAYFVHHPSKFSAKQANSSAKVYDAFLMYSANFAFHSQDLLVRSILFTGTVRKSNSVVTAHCSRQTLVIT